MQNTFEHDPFLDSISKQAREAYENLLRQIQQVRANQGSEGCYMELLDTLKAYANRLLSSIQIPQFEQQIIEAFEAMNKAIGALPRNQSPEIIELVWEQLAKNDLIRTMLSSS